MLNFITEHIFTLVCSIISIAVSSLISYLFYKKQENTKLSIQFKFERCLKYSAALIHLFDCRTRDSSDKYSFNKAIAELHNEFGMIPLHCSEEVAEKAKKLIDFIKKVPDVMIENMTKEQLDETNDEWNKKFNTLIGELFNEMRKDMGLPKYKYIKNACMIEAKFACSKSNK